jgi:hypothetical protein
MNGTIIEIQDTIRVENIILEKGDKIKVIEKLFDINQKDVNIIFDMVQNMISKFYDFRRKEFNVPELEKLEKYVSSKEGIYHKTTSKILVNSPDIAKANEISYVDIHIGLFDYAAYRPEYNTIRVGVSYSPVNFIIDRFSSSLSTSDPTRVSLDAVLKELPSSQVKMMESEFTPARIKGTIHHELSHWVDDMLHNMRISKGLQKRADILNKDKTNNVPRANKKTFGDTDINMTDMEINSQVHTIQTLRRSYRKIWNQMTIYDLISKNSSLMSLYKSFKTEGREKEWLRKIIQRLHREGLLGDNMKSLPSDDSILL